MPPLIDVAPPDQTSLITSMLSRLLIAACLVACVAGQCTVCENVVKAFVETLDAKAGSMLIILPASYYCNLQVSTV